MVFFHLSLATALSATVLGYASNTQSLVDDEVERFVNGIRSGRIRYRQSAESNFTVTFCLCYYHNESCEVINATEESIRSSSFNPALDTKVIIHGYRPFVDEIPAWVHKLARQILTFDLANVIAVNWLHGVQTDYNHARRNAKATGDMVAELLDALLDTHESYDSSNIHLIGFSLGGQAAGFAGKHLVMHNSTRLLGRITGLDPAGPGFNVRSPNLRLDREDAKFVDVIHTDATAQYEFELGLNRNVGDVDFYPNGGSNQAGCTKWRDIAFDNRLVEDMVRYVSCDHTRAVAFFMHSINTSFDNAFHAYPCQNFQRFKTHKQSIWRDHMLTRSFTKQKRNLATTFETDEGRCFVRRDRQSKFSASMGYWLRKEDVPNRGSYYLLTNEEAPYCGNHYKLEIRWSRPRGRSGSTTYFSRIRKNLHKIASFGSTQIYVTVTLVGRNGKTTRTNLDRGELISITPGKTSKHVFVSPCVNGVADLSGIKISIRGDWWANVIRDQTKVNINRVKLFEVKSRMRYVSHSISEADADGQQVFAFEMAPSLHPR